MSVSGRDYFSLRDKTSAPPRQDNPAHSHALNSTPTTSGIKFNLTLARPQSQGNISSWNPNTAHSHQTLLKFDSCKDKDVMRLNVMVEDLNSKLKSSTDRANVAETHLNEMQRALVSERRTYATRMKSAIDEVDAHNDTQKTLLSEIASLKKEAVSKDKRLKETHDNIIQMQIKSTAAQEKIGELESRISCSDKDHALLKDKLEGVEDSDSLKTSLSEAVEQLRLARNEVSGLTNEKNDLTQRLNAALNQLNVKEDAHVKAEAVACGCSTNEEEEEEGDVATSKDEKREMPLVADAVHMHAEYNNLCSQILKVSAEDDDPQNAIRNELIERAKELKANYDLIFGAVSVAEDTVQPTTQSNIKYDTASVRPPNNQMKGADAAVLAHIPYRDDCYIDVSKCSLADVDQEFDVVPTGVHDLQQDHANAIVYDAKVFLSHYCETRMHV